MTGLASINYETTSVSLKSPFFGYTSPNHNRVAEYRCLCCYVAWKSTLHLISLVTPSLSFV